MFYQSIGHLTASNTVGGALQKVATFRHLLAKRPRKVLKDGEDDTELPLRRIVNMDQRGN